MQAASKPKGFEIEALIEALAGSKPKGFEIEALAGSKPKGFEIEALAGASGGLGRATCRGLGADGRRPARNRRVRGDAIVSRKWARKHLSRKVSSI